VSSNVQVGGVDWVAEYISPPDFVQASSNISLCLSIIRSHGALQIVNPGARPATSYEGQLRLLAIYRPNFSVGSNRAEELIRQLLRNEGDIFAFRLDSGLENNTIRATVEYADTNVALEAMSKYHAGLTVDVGTRRLDFPVSLSRRLTRDRDYISSCPFGRKMALAPPWKDSTGSPLRWRRLYGILSKAWPAVSILSA
jgi:hypothetical protein